MRGRGTAMIHQCPDMIKAARLADRRNSRILAVILITGGRGMQ
jgi:hypothetical protein